MYQEFIYYHHKPNQNVRFQIFQVQMTVKQQMLDFLKQIWQELNYKLW